LPTSRGSQRRSGVWFVFASHWPGVAALFVRPGGPDAMSKSENTWIASQRKIVEEYLQRQRVDHLGVGEYPAFHVHPYVAVWAVQSKKAPGCVGWWAISGDLPTDYVSRGKIAHPREALRAFARQWRELSWYMLRGEEHPSIKIATPDQWPDLGDLLRRRARILKSYADNGEIWVGDLAEPLSSPRGQ
jgi:hypothetical protein